MESFRAYFWTALLVAIIAVSLVIVIIFIFINVCISKRAAQYSTRTSAIPNKYSSPEFKNQENEVQHKKFEDEKPPLPPRDQFLSMESVDQGYEDVGSLQDYVVVDESTPPAPQQPISVNYTTVETQNQDQVSVAEDYDDVEMPTNYDSEDYDDVG